MKIYTKTGDEGIASLYNGERRSKDTIIFHALGDVDELNSALGLAREYLENKDVYSEPALLKQVPTLKQSLCTKALKVDYSRLVSK